MDVDELFYHLMSFKNGRNDERVSIFTINTVLLLEGARPAFIPEGRITHLIGMMLELRRRMSPAEDERRLKEMGILI